MGATWDSINFTPKTHITQIKMYDRNFGVFILDTSLYLTLDAGLNWNKINYSNSSFDIMKVQILSPGVIYCYGGMIIDSVSFVCVYKTYDYGKNWSYEKVPKGIRSLYFLNKNVGWAVGGYVIKHYDSSTVSHVHDHQGSLMYKTIDGGRNWTEKFNFLDTINKLSRSIYSIRFIDDINGIAVGVENILYITSDGGENWIRESNDSQSLSVKYSISLLEISGKTKLITGTVDKIYKYFEEPLGIAEETQFAFDGFLISPNPVTDYLIFDSSNEINNVQIYDVLGVKMLETVYKERIDVSSLTPGMYFVRIGDTIRKFVKY
jgi:photosystem II stability/assembly factor-like uncharacterized protein